jgi:glyoxylate/hydroxypyruvate reductase A
MPNAILLAVTGQDPEAWLRHLKHHAPARAIRCWPDDVGDPAEISYLCAWKAPPGVLAKFPNARAIFSLGAGVDHLLADPALPKIPIVRIIHPDLTQRMTEYVVLHTLLIHRRQRLYDAQQRQGVWQEHDQPAAAEVAVGIMGLGALGSDAADALRRIGFRVGGWSRSAKSIDGIETFHGAVGLAPFLARTEILVALLPLTADTRGILSRDLFRKLKRDGALGGAHLINAGRGGLQVDADILPALDDGTLASATLDVFPTEPLPAASPLWTHPHVTITPHNAAWSAPAPLAESIIRQIERFEAGQPLDNLVNVAAGY